MKAFLLIILGFIVYSCVGSVNDYEFACKTSDECGEGFLCYNGKCVENSSDECLPEYEKKCSDGDLYYFDSCGNMGDLAQKCEFGCENAKCLECTPDCEGKECGDDGCGGSCGTCDNGKECENFACVCVLQKYKKCVDGDLYYFDSCGNKGDLAQKCEFGCENGKCLECTPDCEGKECGDDGCGGSCGDCSEGEVCGSDFKCCTPECENKECGNDGCGGSCGECEKGECIDGICAGFIENSVTFSGKITTSPVLIEKNGIAVASINNLYFLGFDLSEKWNFSPDNNQFLYGSPSVLKDGSVVIGSFNPLNAEDSALYIVKNGEPVEIDVASGISTTPTPCPDSSCVIFGDDNGFLWNLSYDGEQDFWEIAWKLKAKDGEVFSSSPVIGENGFVIVASDCLFSNNGSCTASLYAVPLDNPADIALASGLSEYEKYASFSSGVKATPAIDSSGNVFVVESKGVLHIFNKDFSEIANFSQFEDQCLSSPVIDNDGTVFVGCNDKNLYAISFSGGSNLKLKWKFEASSNITSSPLLCSDGNVYFADTKGFVYAVSIDSGKQIFKLDLEAPVKGSPVIDGEGNLYIGTAGGTLFQIKTSCINGLKNTPWPKFKHDNQNTGIFTDQYGSSPWNN